MNYMKERVFRPLTRCAAIDPNEVFADNVCTNLELYHAFVLNMRIIHTNPHRADKWRNYYLQLPKETYVPKVDIAVQESMDWTPIVLPNKPTWEKRGYRVLDHANGREFYHDKVIHAGWNYLRISWNPDPMGGTNRSCSPMMLYADSIVNVEEEIRKTEEEHCTREIKPYAWADGYHKTMVVSHTLSPKINDANVVPYWQPNPLLAEIGGRSDVLEEYYHWVDEKLEWLSMTIEEADDDTKNRETFGQ